VAVAIDQARRKDARELLDIITGIPCLYDFFNSPFLIGDQNMVAIQ
jgi:hypothetical protein